MVIALYETLSDANVVFLPQCLNKPVQQCPQPTGSLPVSTRVCANLETKGMTLRAISLSTDGVGFVPDSFVLLYQCSFILAGMQFHASFRN